MMKSATLAALTLAGALTACVSPDKARMGAMGGFDGIEAARFAVEDVCLPAVMAGKPVTEWFDTEATSSGMVRRKPDATDRQFGVANKWTAQFAGNLEILDQGKDECSVTSRSDRAATIRTQSITIVEARPEPFELLYTGPNAPQTAIRDVYCADLAAGGNTVVLMTTVPQSAQSSFQLTASRGEESCAAVAEGSTIAIPR